MKSRSSITTASDVRTKPEDMTFPDEFDPALIRRIASPKQDSELRRWLPRIGPELGGFLLILVLGISVVAKGLPLSPIDEHAHLDYVLKAGQLHLPGDNEKLGHETRSIIACYGMDNDFPTPECGLQAYGDSSFPDEGFSESAASPPTYFLLTGLTARLIRALSPVDDLLFSARIANWLWLCVGGSILIRMLRKRGVQASIAISFAIIFAINPVMATSGANVNPDSMVPLAGLLIYCLAFSDAMRGWRSVALIPCAMILLSVDGSVSLALMLTIVLLALDFLGSAATSSNHRFRFRPTVKTRQIGGTFVGLVTAYLLGPTVISTLRHFYSGSEGTRTVLLPRDSWFQRPSLSLETIFGSFPGSFPPFRGGYDIPPLRVFEFGIIIEVCALLVAGSLIASCLSSNPVRTQIHNATITIFGVFALPLMTLLLWLRGGGFWSLTPRYAVAIILIIILTAAVSIKSRAGKAIVVLSALSATLTYLSLIFAY